MEKPKCRLCGERHWGLCAPTPKQVFEAREATLPPAEKPFDRKAYQKEYMRGYMKKYRAAKNPKNVA